MHGIDYLPTYFSSESSDEYVEDNTPVAKYCNVKIFYRTNRISQDSDHYMVPTYEQAVKFSEYVRKNGFMRKEVSGVTITPVY